jgi:type VI secretion system secreted protein VgrG
VQTPYAGAGKGYYFIPEVGEEVWVEFEEGNPDKAYVSSGHYNGMAVSGYGTAGNVIKAIHTKSGTRIVFNDKEGSVHIEDAGGSTWDMDGKGSINVHAPDRISLNAKTIALNAVANISASAGAGLNMSGGTYVGINSGGILEERAQADYTLIADNIFKRAKNDITTQAETGSKQASDDVTITSEEGNVSKHAQKQLEINSGEKTKVF